jgi:hypothetical protein
VITKYIGALQSLKHATLRLKG